MSSRKEKDNERVQQFIDNKKNIRENYSRFPFIDWFKKKPPVERVPSVEFENKDILAMILAVLSLVIPWVLGISAGLAVIVWLITLIGR